MKWLKQQLKKSFRIIPDKEIYGERDSSNDNTLGEFLFWGAIGVGIIWIAIKIIIVIIQIF